MFARERERLQRERGERGVSPEDPGGQKEPPVLAALCPKGEDARDHANEKAASNVDRERRPRKRGRGSERRSVNGVAQRATDAGAEKDDEVAVEWVHVRLGGSTASPNC